MPVLPLYFEIERPRPVIEPCLNHLDLLSGLVLPAIFAAEQRRWQEMQNRDSVKQEKTKADGSQAKPQNDASTEQRLSQELKDEERTTLVPSDAGNFEVSLDVQLFSPDELSVKTANGYVVIEGKHEEKQDEHGHVSRRFVRRYALPEGCHPDAVQSRLSSDGVLTVTAPKRAQPALDGERAVPMGHEEPAMDAPSTSRQQQKGVLQ